MKRFLTPLLALIALPTPTYAANYKYHLLLAPQGKNYVVPMRSKSACEKALQKALNIDNYQYNNKAWKPKGVVGICLPSE
tara:strand:- start:105 stop:344 length:240 start_codon:yes stop_codon:yes gene_type:complete